MRNPSPFFTNLGCKLVRDPNRFHGDLYEYNRISTFASDSFNNNALWAASDHSGLSTPKPRYVHNQFGYFVSGPIKHDKLFFSSATEWTRVRSSSYVSAEVPLPGLISQSAANMQAYLSAYGALQFPVNGPTYTARSGFRLDSGSPSHISWRGIDQVAAPVARQNRTKNLKMQ